MDGESVARGAETTRLRTVAINGSRPEDYPSRWTLPASPFASRGSPLRSRKPSHSPTPFPSTRCKNNHVQDRGPPKRLASDGRQSLRQRKHASRQQKLRKRHAQSWVPVERRQKQAKSAREQQDFKQLRCDGFRVACHDSRWANDSDQWLAP